MADANVVAAIRRIGRQKGATPKEIKAAFETGIVESGLQNLPGGDADSAGWRQERPSLYKNPTDLNASISRFFDETRAVRGKYGRAGDLAAAVQRPAAQFRGRYQANSAAAQKLLQGSGSSAAAPAGKPGKLSITGSVTAAHDVPDRGAAVEAVLRQGSHSGLPDFRKSRLAEADHLFRLGLATKTVPTQATQTITSTPARAGGATGGSSAEKVIQRVNVFDKANRAGKLNYKWGGGHAGKLDVLKSGAVPVDCSGLVSAAIGVNPRVASQFKTWGRPGQHSDSTIVVYAKNTHVLAKVKGRDGKWHFFGTSASNAGGGAGWIPASKVGAGYLKGFTVRSN